MEWALELQSSEKQGRLLKGASWSSGYQRKVGPRKVK